MDSLNQLAMSLKANVEKVSEKVTENVAESVKIISDRAGGLENAGNDFLRSNTIVTKFAFIILVLIIFVFSTYLGIYMVSYFASSSKSPYLVHGALDGNNSVIVTQDPSDKYSVPIPRSDNETKGIECTWSIWLLLKNNTTNADHYQNIFNKGDIQYDTNGISKVNNAPGLYLKNLVNHSNQLHIMMDTVNPSLGPAVIDIDNVPFNKWFNCIIRLENKILDVYINGTIASRRTMLAIPKQNYNNVNICQNGGFMGQLSNLRYYSKSLSAIDIGFIVNYGPNVTISDMNTTKVNDSYFLSRSWYTNQNT